MFLKCNASFSCRVFSCALLLAWGSRILWNRTEHDSFRIFWFSLMYFTFVSLFFLKDTWFSKNFAKHHATNPFLSWRFTKMWVSELLFLTLIYLFTYIFSPTLYRKLLGCRESSRIFSWVGGCWPSLQAY